MVRDDLARPLPWHTSQGSCAMSPRPLQSTHGSVSEKPPPEPRDTWPVPTHVGQTRGVPFLSPVPEQAWHGCWLDMRSGTVAPSTASVKLSVTSDSTSWPRRGCVRAPVPPRPNSPPNTSPRPPPKPPAPAGAALRAAGEEVAQVEAEGAPGARSRAEAAVAEEGARLVVLLALLRVAEDVVRLGDLL